MHLRCNMGIYADRIQPSLDIYSPRYPYQMDTDMNSTWHDIGIRGYKCPITDIFMKIYQ